MYECACEGMECVRCGTLTMSGHGMWGWWWCRVGGQQRGSGDGAQWMRCGKCKHGGGADGTGTGVQCSGVCGGARAVRRGKAIGAHGCTNTANCVAHIAVTDGDHSGICH